MKDFLKIWFPVILLIAAVFWLSAQFIKPAPTKELTIATGRKGGSYFEFANRYKLLLENQGIKINIIETAGSLEILKLLNEHKADIGFVQGGTIDDNSSYENLEAIASIYYEPLWLFMKESKKSINYVSQLKNKKVSIGEVGSGTSMLVRQIAKANAIDIEAESILHLSLNKSYKALKEGKIDAFFSVVSTEAPTILKLLEDDTIEAISLKRVKAYEKLFSYLSGITIYEGSIDLVNNLPKKDINLLATTATLAVHKDVDDTLVRLFAKVVKNENHRHDGFPNIKYLQLPVNPQAKSYLLKGDTVLEKIFPYWIAVNIDRFKIMIIPFLTLLIPMFKGFLPLYRWRIRSKIYRWYKQLDKQEQNWEKYDQKELKKAIGELKNLQKEIKEQVDVPLSYMNEYYQLKTHVDFVLKKMIDK
jgi:TRAP transporter TAXI family solute receptor